MKTQLLPHNQEAYEKIMRAFENSNRTCVIHPTGTGKSYLTAAVSENFRRVLVLAPNIFALEQVRGVMKWHEGAEFMTYAALMNADVKQYDLIVLDEFHRTGAQEWGAAVQRLLAANPNAKVFGTSATPVRDLDGGRDMSKELFNGNIASQMGLGDAWANGILPIPIYVTGLYSFQKTEEELKSKINGASRLDGKHKKERLSELKNISLDWEKSKGMAVTLNKYLPKGIKRIIVFVDSLDNINSHKRMLRKWFMEIGVGIDAILTVNSRMSATEREETFRNFQNDGNGVKIMMAYNMLNESTHIPGVDAVIMLRSTQSRIVYMQQMGRCFDAGKKSAPIVFDMVDNMTKTNSIIDEVKDSVRVIVNGGLIEWRDSVCAIPCFTVFDELVDIRTIIQAFQLDTNSNIPYNERIDMLSRFCSRENRLPLPMDERGEYNNWICLQSYYKTEEVMSFYYRYGVRYSEEKLKEELLTFIKQKGYFPRTTDKEECRLRNRFDRRKNMLLKDKEIMDIYIKYCRPYNKEKKIKIIENFIRDNNRPPSVNDGEIYRIWCSVIKHHKEDARVKKIMLQYKRNGAPKLNVISSIQPIKDFFTEKHKIPNSRSNNDKERSIAGRWRYLLLNYRENEEVQHLIKLANEIKNERKAKRII